MILWSVRLGSSRQQFNFIYTRLARSARQEIPRLRFDFKHATREVGDKVQESLVEAFLNEYLEADGYFFIRLLAANSSDFIVQEVIEQLWATYVMKYGETDAQRFEEEFFKFHLNLDGSQLFSQTSTKVVSAADGADGLNDSERKYLKQHSDVGVGLLSATTTFQPIPQQREEV